MHRRVFSSICDRYLLDITLLRQSKMSLDIAKCSPGGKHHPWLRTMALEASESGQTWLFKACSHPETAAPGDQPKQSEQEG